MLRVDVVKKSITARSSNDGEFETSTTTAASRSASARPTPVRVLTPVSGDAGTASWPCAVSAVTTFEPIRPVPPMMTSFIGISLPCARLSSVGRLTIAARQMLLGGQPVVHVPAFPPPARLIELIREPGYLIA